MAEFKQMTLSQCAKFDETTGQKHILTGWGKICIDRNKRGISRSQRVKANKARRELKEGK